MFPLDGRLIYMYNFRAGNTVSGSNITGDQYGFSVDYVNSASASTWTLSTIFEDGVSVTSGGSYGPSSGTGSVTPGTTLFTSATGAIILSAASDGSTVYFNVKGIGGVTQFSFDPTTGVINIATNVGLSTRVYADIKCSSE